MSITPAQLQELMKEVEIEDPIDFADLPFAEEELRAITALHVCEMGERLENFSESDRHLTLLAVAAKLALENMVLHIQLLREHEAPMSAGVHHYLQGFRLQK
jgi:hypothetical protein